MGGTAARVNVHAVWFAVDDRQIHAQLPQSGRRGQGGGAVGAVHRRFDAVQTGIDGSEDVADVVLDSGIYPFHSSDVRAVRQIAQVDSAPDHSLDPVLQGVVQLVAVFIEKLDAIVFHGVVGGGDHGGGVRLVFPGEPGQSRGGNDPHRDRGGAGGAEASCQGRFQHVAGDTGVPSDQDPGLVGAALGEDHGGGPPDVKAVLCGQLCPGNAADAVRSE